MKDLSCFLLATLVLVVSCSKEQNESNIINEAKVNEVLKAKVPFTQRNALFAMLNADEKAALWKKHLSLFLPAPSFTEKQQTILKEVISAITPDIFQESTKARYTGKMAALEYKAKEAFPIKIYFLIFEMYSSGIEDIKDGETISSVAAPPVGSDCYCRSSSWCGSALGADLALCLWNNEGSNCNTTSGGCGMIGWSDCRGVCCLGSNCY